MFQLLLFGILAKKLGASKIRGALRVAGYTVGVSAALGAVGVHKARAAFEEKGMELGADMATLSSLVHNANTFTLNGQRIHMGTSTTLEGMNTVLDRFEASCKAAEGGNVAVWNSVPDMSTATPEEKEAAGSLTAIPILRTQKGNKGTIACIVPSAASTPHTVRAVATAVDSFSETGHLSELGKLRYAYVTEGRTGTSVATIWTDDDFNMRALVPEDGSNADTPGTDPSLMKRPAQAQRLLTGTVEGMAYRIYAYQVNESPQDAIAHYDAAMIGAGWMSVKDPLYENAPHDQDAEIRGYMLRDGRQGYVTTFSDREHHTLMGVVEVGPDAIEKAPVKPLADADGF